jgi:signal transduction histidine kinase
MDRQEVYESSPLLIVGVGLLVFVAAASHHLTEAMNLGVVVGPAIALMADGLPALGVVYGGYYLSRTDFEPENEWRVFLATVGGSLIVSGVIGLGILVRLREGRPISEPPFQMLLGTSAGLLAGFVAGYYYARSRESARRSTRTMSTLAFTNRVLRHDIKNDMTVIRGRANVIADTDPEDELVVDSAQTITNQVDKVLTVLDSTGAISQAISDDPDFDEVDLAEIVGDVVDHCDDSLPGTVTRDTPESATIRGNEAVRTVVTNLVENGIEHNDSDDPCVHVTVEPAVDSVFLRVHDNGPGVPDGEKQTLFEARPDDMGKGGLHVVSTLVENFGGEIRVEDNEPRGAVFVVELQRP